MHSYDRNMVHATSRPVDWQRYVTSAVRKKSAGYIFLDDLRIGPITTAVGTCSPGGREGFPFAASSVGPVQRGIVAATDDTIPLNHRAERRLALSYSGNRFGDIAHPDGSQTAFAGQFVDGHRRAVSTVSRPDKPRRRADVTMSMVDKFLTEMYQTNSGFVFD